MKLMYYNFLHEMDISSQLLHNNGNYHTACYLGGYVLESYLKILILVGNDTGEHIREHKYTKLLDKIYLLRYIYPKDIKIDQYIDLTSKTQRLVLGSSSNNRTNPSWDPDRRYNVNIWNDANHSQKIQEEIKLILKEMAKLIVARGGF